MAHALNESSSDRLESLDAYRGFVMLAMVSGGLGLSHVTKHYDQSPFWKGLDYQLEHVPWIGCSAWDLIQPSFMFIVGVAMPFSYAQRSLRGDTKGSMWGHVLWRALLLVMIGIFLRSNGRPQTNFTFEDVSTQIGLGYAFVFLILGWGTIRQWIVVTLILFGYWLLFALWPTPTADFDPAKVGIPGDWNQLSGFASHWNKHVNPAGFFDRWFLNLFPRPEPFQANGGGYQTLSFIPSMATTIFGVLAGELLRGPRSVFAKVGILLLWGLAFLALGVVLDPSIFPYPIEGVMTVAPIVKRIWTPSWAIFSTGWTLVLLSAFLLVIDGWGMRGWAFPLKVVGMNSIAMYVMSWVTKPWIKESLRTHLGTKPFEGLYGPVIESAAVLFILWLICYWMYRRRLFIRI